jgi:Ca2+-transporting ATPase
LLPVHIAFLHLIIDPACSVVFGAEPATPLSWRGLARPAQLLFGRRPRSEPSRSSSAPRARGRSHRLYRGQGFEARALTFTALIVANLSSS